MKRITFLALASACWSCQTAMNKDQILAEVAKAEHDLLSTLRSGDILKGVAIHLDSPDYRNIWNGEIKTFAMLEARIQAGLKNGLKSFDYDVKGREFSVIGPDAVLETMTAIPTTTLQSGQTSTDGLTAISLLWLRVDGRWRLGYLHASELPKP